MDQHDLNEEICPICGGSCPCCGFHYRWRPRKTVPVPEGNKRILTYTPDDKEEYRYRILPADLVFAVREATHWMPLEPPEKVAMTKTEAEDKLMSIIKEINDAGFRPTISVIRLETGDDGKTYGAYYLEEILPDHIQIVNDDTESFD